MTKRALIIVLSTVASLAVLVAVGLFAYDTTQKHHIAEGVQVGGVDVGGMTANAARAKLQAAYLDPLQRTITVRAAGRTFHLTAKQAKVAANVDAMVDEALRRSREGNPFSRAVRDITGGKVNADLTPEVTYDKEAVAALVERMRKRVNRPATNASVSFQPTGLQKTDGQDGVQLQSTRLERKIEKAIVSPNAKRHLKAAFWKKKPAVTTADVAKQYDTALVVDRASFQLKLYKNLKLVKTYDVAVGAQGLETPAGLYHIQNKEVDPAWHVPYSSWTGSLAGQTIPGGAPNNPLKARWLGIFDGAGIHGVDPSEYGSIGHAASHGCVRMRIDDVIDLYPQVPVGAPIYIS
jgi:lipoprotein-anchoring transpeptidase ErfK/SrfK